MQISVNDSHALLRERARRDESDDIETASSALQDD
jgi:hypothetical protein